MALLEARFWGWRDAWFAVTEKSRKWLESEVKRLKSAVDRKPVEPWAKEHVGSLPAA